MIKLALKQKALKIMTIMNS